MHLAMMPTAKRDRELIADLAAGRWRDTPLWQRETSGISQISKFR
jgi:hypothetical protein